MNARNDPPGITGDNVLRSTHCVIRSAIRIRCSALELRDTVAVHASGNAAASVRQIYDMLIPRLRC